MAYQLKTLKNLVPAFFKNEISEKISSSVHFGYFSSKA